MVHWSETPHWLTLSLKLLSRNIHIVIARFSPCKGDDHRFSIINYVIYANVYEWRLAQYYQPLLSPEPEPGPTLRDVTDIVKRETPMSAAIHLNGEF